MELLGPEIFWSRRQRAATGKHTEQPQTKICDDSAQFATQIRAKPFKNVQPGVAAKSPVITDNARHFERSFCDSF